MEEEKLNLIKDTPLQDLKIRFCGYSKCMPNHKYGPGSRPYYLLHLVLSGKGKLFVNNKEYQLHEGQLFLVEPNRIISYIADEEDPWTYSWVGFNGNTADLYMKRLEFAYPTLIRNINKKDFNNMGMILNELVSLKVDEATSELRANGLLFLFLSYLGNPKKIADSNDLAELDYDSFVDKAIFLVEQHYGESLTVEKIAKRLNINRTYLSHIFVKQTGFALKQYIVNFRITQSEEMLFTTNWSIDLISRLCGFNDPSYFSKKFKNKWKVSPTQYRQERRSRDSDV